MHILRRWMPWAAALVGCALLAAAARATGDELPGTANPPVPWRDWSASVNGGAEWYGGSLFSKIDPGPTWGFALQYEPTREIGFEVGYSGSSNTVVGAPGLWVTRNGGYLAVTPGYSFPLDRLHRTELKPYVLGGVGWNYYSVSGNGSVYGFSTTASPTVPVGGGLRLRTGQLNLDARFDAAWGFGNAFAAGTSTVLRYQTVLLLGVAY